MGTIELDTLATIIRERVERAIEGQRDGATLEGYCAASTAYHELGQLAREVAAHAPAPREFATRCGLPNLRL